MTDKQRSALQSTEKSLSPEVLEALNRVNDTIAEVNGRFIVMLNDKVLLKLIAPERHFHGLYVPDSAKREAWQLWQGEVLAVGPGDFSKKGVRIPCGLNKGDTVLFYSVGGKTATRWPTKEHVILSAEYVQCVLEDV